jgi:predicted transcriptional regulator of viral defense system
MASISGIGKKSRVKLGKVLAHCKSKLITPDKVVDILQISKIQANRLLQYWEKNGWLYRIRRGLYQPLAVETDHLQTVIEDSWVVAHKLFSSCYTGGWSAIEFWGLTEQIFQTVIVITSRRFSQKNFQLWKI